MKAFYIIYVIQMLLFFVSNPLLAQDNTYASSTNVWTQTFLNESGVGGSIRYTLSEEEVEIDGYEYKKILYSLDESGPFEKEEMNGFIRQNGSKVYLYSSLDDTEILLYDFEHGLGDTLYGFSPYPYYVVSSVEVINIDGKEKRRITYDKHLEVIDIWESCFVVLEDIGSLSGFIPYELLYVDWCPTDVGTSTTCFSRNDTLIWSNPDWDNCWNIRTSNFELDENSKISISPNPNSGRFKINGIEEQVHIVIRNENGRMLYNRAYGPQDEVDIKNLSSGLYFIQIWNNKGLFTKKVLFH